MNQPTLRFIPRKGEPVKKDDRLGITLRRQGANHVRVKTERIRPFQEFRTGKVTEVKCVCEETWPLDSITPATTLP